MSNKEKLFSEFQAPTTQEWLDKIQVDLKGADFQKRLVWRTNEGFNVQPFYRREDLKDLHETDALPGEFPFVRGNKKDNNLWYVRQNIDASDAVTANAKALDILGKGVNSIGFSIPSDKLSADFIATLLKGINPEKTELNFKTCQRHCVELAQLLTTYFKSQNANLDSLQGSIDFDPLGKILKKGANVSAIFTTYAKPLIEALAELPQYRCFAVNTILLNNAGAYIYQELGYALAWGNEYLQKLTEEGIDATEAGRRIKFNMGISENYFMEIAKFRAARMLWAEIVKQYEPKCICACQMHVCAQTSAYNQTMYDSYVNLLRSQTEAMSAALANVDSIIVTPFDASYQTPDEFSERLARNQQLLLKEEAHFDKIVDVAGGSYYVEHLTDSLAKEGWKVFLAVEEEGGFQTQALAGKIQHEINATNDKRHADAAKRKEFMLGTNQFPNFNETSEGKRPQVHQCCCHSEKNVAPAIEKLNADRLASQFESLRLETEAASKRPTAFMLTIGNLAMRQARAQFSCNFLACAGYKVIDNLGFQTVEEGVDAALNADADIVVLCSSDDEYAEYAIPAFKYLNNRAMFVVAGAPACSDDLRTAGIENFIHVRVNQLDTLKEYNAKLLKK